VKISEVDDEGVVKRVVGACDEELLGKTFREEDLILEVNEEFFGGELMELDEAVAIIEMANNVMAVGERLVNKLVEAGLVHPLAIRRIGGVPYTLILRYEP